MRFIDIQPAANELAGLVSVFGFERSWYSWMRRWAGMCSPFSSRRIMARDKGRRLSMMSHTR